ncbi:MAG: hypothetical protein K8H75_13300 [Sulfuricella sp.]|nr:hypothetical protein [Sulfuricella sp.]
MAADVGTNCASFVSGSAILGAIVGYGLRIWLANQIANRKEDWDRLHKLTDMVNELVDEAIDFFCIQDTTKDERQKKCIRIQRLIANSGQQAYSLSTALGAQQISACQKRLRQSITMDEFDADVTRAPLAQSDDRILGIETACGVLIGVLNMHYARKYRGSSKA